jgi:hypothetical protein
MTTPCKSIDRNPERESFWEIEGDKAKETRNRYRIKTLAIMGGSFSGSILCYDNN